MLIRVIYFSIWACILLTSFSHGYRDNGKFLGNDLIEEDRHLGKRRRPGYQGNQGPSPCNFGGGGGGGYGKPKDQGTGRTFFDLQYHNLENNYNLNIDCGGNGGSYPAQPAPVTELHPIAGDQGGGHKPLGGSGGGGGGGNKPFGGGGGGNKPFGGGNRPHRPGKPGGGGGFGNGGGLFGGGNRPHKPQGGYGDSSSGAVEADSNPGFSSGPFAGWFPSPQQFASGLSEGLQSFIETIPAIGHSFQSILPSFSDFQWPQLPQFNPGGTESGSGGSFTNPFNRPPAVVAPVATTPSIVTPAPTTTTTDPDDIIYSDELKPVHEDYDPITDPYSSNKLPPGHLSSGQYLVISNPHLGSYTHQISAFNPTNLYNRWQQGVKEALQEFGSYF